MGLTLEFVTGDDEPLEALLRRAAWDELDSSAAVVAQADFSLHLRPRDLDALSRAMAVLNRQPPRDLRSAMDVLVDEPDHGLLRVSADWVRYAAATPPEAAPELTRLWFAELDGDDAATAEACAAVGDLIALCSTAEQAGSTVYHWWVGGI